MLQAVVSADLLPKTPNLRGANGTPHRVHSSASRDLQPFVDLSAYVGALWLREIGNVIYNPKNMVVGKNDLGLRIQNLGP